MAARIVSYYTLAVVVALALLYLSLFWVPWGMYMRYVDVAVAILLSGALATAFAWGYMTYALREWGDFVPQGAGLMVLYVFAYAMMYTSLMSIVLTRAGAVSLAVWGAFIASAALMIYILRGVPLHITSGNPIEDLKAGTRTLPLALVVGIPMGWAVVAAYEAYRMYNHGAKLAAASVVASLIFGFTLYPIFAVTHGSQAALALQYSGVEILFWPGITGWEELTSRFMLPAVGPIANYMFVVFHIPSRLFDVMFWTPAVMAVISMGTRWITDIYRRHGLIGAIAGHSVYNGMVLWIDALIYFPLLTLVTMVLLVYVYIRTSSK
jgi:hypothetical protein